MPAHLKAWSDPATPVQLDISLMPVLAEANLRVCAPCPWQGLRQIRGLIPKFVLMVSALPLAALTAGRSLTAWAGLSEQMVDMMN